MGLETWTAFALASVALLLIPGPTILLVIGQSLGAGLQGTGSPGTGRQAFLLRGRWRNALLVTTFVGRAALNALAYGLLAGRLSGAVTRPAVRRRLNRVGGAMLVGAGLATATMRRA